MGEEAVRYEARGPAAWLTIDREERRNALSDDVIDGLLGGLGRAAADEAARVVVVTGAGERAFCAGGDLAGNLSPGEGRVAAHDRRGRVAELLRALAEHPRPVVARVNGVALAGGFGLMLACDLVVAADEVEMGTPEINLGLWPYMISAVIHRNVPRKVALEMMLTGRRLGARDAARWGIVNRAVPRADLDAAVDELVGELSSKSPLVLALGKRSFYRAQDMGFDDALAYLQAMLTVNLESEDVAEGVAAFLEKRPPTWKGR
ncbi:MAG: enoyl-CoA hydratase/isomerase family protein [Actinobacteria bacterium]|nr:enoyl-CoA hydratase/isomerase family protein [Actinomycetota bacterium]